MVKVRHLTRRTTSSWPTSASDEKESVRFHADNLIFCKPHHKASCYNAGNGSVYAYFLPALRRDLPSPLAVEVIVDRRRR